MVLKRPLPSAGGPQVTGTAMLLSLCFVLAQADKQATGLLAGPIQRSLALTDGQLGWVQGGAFAIAFAIGGLPIARLLDSGNRVKIAAACVALWSVATILCGVATSLLLLLLCRGGTAVAEAGLPPAAFSIFSQSGDRRSLARLTSGFMLAPFIGGGLMLVLGGLLLKSLPEHVDLLVGSAERWRVVFFAVGLSGFVIAAALLLLGREPHRATTPMIEAALPTLGSVLTTIFVEDGFLRFYFSGLTAFYLFMAALIAWYPIYLVREFGLRAGTAGEYAGLTYLGAGVLGTFFVNLLASVRADATVASMSREHLVAAILLAPISIALPLVGNLGVSLTLYGSYAFLSAAILSTMAVPIQVSLPDTMRARGTAVLSFLMSAIAGGAGPVIVGMLSERAHLPLGGALALVAGVAMVIATSLLFLARRGAARDDINAGALLRKSRLAVERI